MDLAILCLLFLVALSSKFPYTPCSSSILNPRDLSCATCPVNYTPDPNEKIPTSCACQSQYYSTLSSSNTCVSTNCAPPNVYSTYSLNGTFRSGSCITCDSKARPDSQFLKCIPCPLNMNYNTVSKQCVCQPGFTVYSPNGCFINISLSTVPSKFSSTLSYAIPACVTFSDYLSCSQLVNLCIYSLMDMTTPECAAFNSYNLTSKLYSVPSSSFSLTAGQSSTLTMKLTKYLSSGNYISEQLLQLSDIMRCSGLSSVPLAVGNNIEKRCEFDFSYIVARMSAKSYRNYLYQLFIMGDDRHYYEVNAYIQGSSQAVKRFFLEDTFSVANALRVVTTMKISLDLSTSGALSNPSIYLTYTQISLEPPSSTYLLSLDYSLIYNYDLSNFWTGCIASFIVICMLSIVHAVIRTYIGYLNRKTPLLFFLNWLSAWSMWMFYYLLFITGYWYIFTKTPASVYILIPKSSLFYTAFYTVAAIMGASKIICVLIDKMDKLQTDVFIVNWEKNGQFKNSWREIFIINNLAEFYTHRTISFFWILAVQLFFMTGLSWEKNATETVTASGNTSLNPRNRLFLYFLSSSIMLVIAITCKILRRLSVLFWPYPFQNFVDYCNVTNISFFFIKKKSAEAYYIHATIPERTDVTCKQINEAIRKGIQKNRSIASEMPDSDLLKLYAFYMGKPLLDRYNQLLRKIEDYEHSQNMKYSKEGKKSKITATSLREEFTEKALKPAIENISNRENDSRRKSFLQSTFGLPPVNLRDDEHLRNSIYFDDKLDLTNQVFPNGNEFQEIHTLIIVYLMWILITNSSPIAALLTYLFDEYVMNAWIRYKCRDNLQRMTKVKAGFMM